MDATVAITGGTFAGDGDLLTVDTTGTGITASYDSTTEKLTLTGSDTAANYATMLESVTFTTLVENPNNFGSDPSRTIVWTVNDGSASNNSGTATTTVNIANVNDPPTLVNVVAGAQYTEEGGAVTLSNAVTITDPDNLDLASATVAIAGRTFAGDSDVLAANVAGTNITASYNASTETLTLTGSDTLADYQTVLDSVTFIAGENPTDFGSNPIRTLTWVADDGSASFNLSSAATTTIAITNINDPPTLANVAAGAQYTEEGGAITLSGAITPSDPDDLTLAAATVAITGGTFAGDSDVLAANVAGTNITASYDASTETLTLTGSDTLANYQAVLDSVTFIAGENPNDFGSNPTRTVTWVADDGSGSFNLSNAATTTIAITNVNDAPTLTGVAASASFTEQSAPATLSANVTVSDPDDTGLVGATVSITAGTFAGDADVLSTNVAGTNITASYNATTETLTLTGSDTLADYQSVLDKVTFSEAGDNPTNYGSNPIRTITWVLNDGHASNNLSTVQTETLSITNVNDPPTLANVAATVGFLPHHTITISPSIGVSDADNLTLSNATVAITAGSFAGDGDVLAANVSGTNITASYNAVTETLTLSGVDTLAHYQSVLDSVTFASGNNPSHGNSNRIRTVTWVVNDGSGSNNLATASTTIAIPPAPPRNDFNGDGMADILFQNNNGTPMIWEMNGTSVAASATLSDPGSQWHAIGTSDFNGDGDADILFQNTNGTPLIWEMNGTSVVSTFSLPNPGPPWKLQDDGPIPANQMGAGGDSGSGTMRQSAPDGIAGAALDSGGTPGVPFALAGSDRLLFPGGDSLGESPQLNNQRLTSLGG